MYICIEQNRLFRGTLTLNEDSFDEKFMEEIIFSVLAIIDLLHDPFWKKAIYCHSRTCYLTFYYNGQTLVCF